MGKDGVRVNAVAAGPLATTAAKNIPDLQIWMMSGTRERH